MDTGTTNFGTRNESRSSDEMHEEGFDIFAIIFLVLFAVGIVVLLMALVACGVFRKRRNNYEEVETEERDGRSPSSYPRRLCPMVI